MKKLGFIAVLTLVCALAWSQGTVRVQAPELVGLGEQFNVTVTAEGDETPGKPSWEEKDGVQIKVCKNCNFPHKPENYDIVLEVLRKHRND